MGPKSTSPSPAAPLLRTPQHTDGHVRHERGRAHHFVLPEKSPPGGAKEIQCKVGQHLQVEPTAQNLRKKVIITSGVCESGQI